MISTEFLLTSLVVVLMPGTGVIYTVSIGLGQGGRASVFAALGCTLGIVPHLLATMAGLAAVLHTSALVFQVFKGLGAAYLLYLAWVTWRDRSGLSVSQEGAALSATGLFMRGFLINILNPKLTIFFLSFLPQFIQSASGAILPQMLVLSAIFMAMTFVVFVGYGAVAHSFRRVVAESARVQAWMRWGFATAFAALGVRLATSGQH